MSTVRDGRPTWAEIDGGAFARNVETIAARLPAGTRLIAVLTADGYGHGAVELARLCRPDKVAMIATALREESIELRRAGIELPLLVFGPLTPAQIGIAERSRHHVAPGVTGIVALADRDHQRHHAVGIAGTAQVLGELPREAGHQ